MSHKDLLLGGDLPVGRLGFGAMRLTGPDAWGPPADRGAAIAVVRRAVERGVTFIDTADAYGPGISEEIIAEALYPYPAHLAVATKAGQCRPSRSEWKPLGRPEYLRQQAELSLRRLRVERIDLFQLHRVDPRVPLADQVGALKQLQEQGKIRHIGLSEVTVDRIEEARAVAEIVSVQNRYNLTTRHYEEVLRYCAREGLAFIPWEPIADGAHARADGTLATVAPRPRRQPGPSVAGLAAPSLLSPDAHPRHLTRRSPRGEPGCRRHRADPRPHGSSPESCMKCRPLGRPPSALHHGTLTERAGAPGTDRS